MFFTVLEDRLKDKEWLISVQPGLVIQFPLALQSNGVCGLSLMFAVWQNNSII